jgi:probable rRNA maturation factor
VAVLGAVARWRVPRAGLRAVLQAYLKALGMPKAGVTLQMVGDGDSRELNRRFRRKDKATDVLSFPALEGRVPKGYAGYLGDLAIDLPYAWQHRGRFDPDFGAEVCFLALHGLLHLSGQHHDNAAQERAMWRLSRRHHPLCRPHLAALRILRPLKKRP